MHDMMNELGRHSFNMKAFMGDDLDHLVKVMTGALQEVHEEQPETGALPRPGPSESRGGKEGNREPVITMDREQDLKSDKVQNVKQEEFPVMKEQGRRQDWEF